MELKKIIIHEIEKESGSNETEIRLSDELIPNNNDSTALISALLNSYKGDRILYAIFDNEDGNYFPRKFSEYRQTDRNTNGFIDFTKGALRNLKPIIKAKTLARGGYYIFAEYVINGVDFVSIFLIRDTEGKILHRTEHSFRIQTIEYLDTNNLAMACRINETRIENNETNYLSFTQLKQKEIADYFLDWITIQKRESSSEYTKMLYDLVNQIEPPINKKTNKAYHIEEFRNLVYQYVTTNPKKTVNLRDLGQNFYNDPEKIIDFADEINILIDTEFRFNKRQLRKFIQLEVNKDGINLKFSRGIFNEKVKFSEENVNVVIIESAPFAEALRNEIDNN